MSFTQYLSQGLTIAADGIHSASQSTSEKLTGAVDLGTFRKVLFIVDSGTLGASGTLDFQVKGSATSGGTYTAIPGSAITQLVVASNNNQYAFVEVDAAKVQGLGLGYRFIKGSLLPGTAASNSAVVVLGAHATVEPTSGNAATTLAQTVTVAP